MTRSVFDPGLPGESDDEYAARRQASHEQTMAAFETERKRQAREAAARRRKRKAMLKSKGFDLDAIRSKWSKSPIADAARRLKEAETVLREADSPAAPLPTAATPVRRNETR